MSRKKAIVTICAVTLIGSAIAIAVYGQGGRGSRQNRRPAIPQHVVYHQVFHHIVMLQQQAEEKERQGQDASSIRALYKRNAKLNDDQAKALDEIASATDREVSELDAQAKTIIDAYRAQTPGGKLAEGGKPPEPPAELEALQKKREAAILKGVNRLHAAFGNGEFQRFDQFVQRNIENNTKPIGLDFKRPQLPDSPRQQRRP